MRNSFVLSGCWLLVVALAVACSTSGGSGNADGGGGTRPTGETCGWTGGGVCTQCAQQKCCAEGNACEADSLCKECKAAANAGDQMKVYSLGCSQNAAYSAAVDCINDSSRCGPICNPGSSCGTLYCITDSDCTRAGCFSCGSSGICQ